MIRHQSVDARPPRLMEPDALSLPLVLEERSGMRRCNEPVTVGIPLPKGAVLHPARLVLVDQQDRPCPVQIQPLAHWFDGSIKWALLDFQANVAAHEQAVYHLQYTSTPVTILSPHRLTVQHSAEATCIDTGQGLFFVNSRLCKPLDRVVVRGVDLLDAAGSRFVLTDEAGREYEPHLEKMAVATSGPLRVTIHMQGELRLAGGLSRARYVTRLSFYAGHNLVQLRITLHNPRAAHHPGGLWDLGDEGSIYFQDVSLHLPLGAQAGLRTDWQPQMDQPYAAHAGTHLTIYQDSSGGENWQSANHVNRFGKVMHTFQGYRVSADGHPLHEGKRATPLLALHGSTYGVAATVAQFWQNFPKALEVHNNQLSVRLFPQQYNDVYELQGGEQKTHTVYVLFSDTPEQWLPLAWVHDRLLPRTTPEWYASSRAFNYLTPGSSDRQAPCATLLATVIAGPHSFFARRESIDEYGWRHFGDLYADHEAVGHTGETPLVSHYNNQYDTVYGALVQYASSGDQRWFELARDLAQHVIDIDIYHTQEDRPAYNGGLFWHTDHYLDAATATHRAYSRLSVAPDALPHYGGGPSNEHNYTTGLLHYYFFTGDMAAREAVQGLADWVRHMDDGAQRWLGRLDRRPTGLCSATVDRNYHGPGRGAGNSINALLDAYLLTHDALYMHKAEQLICRCIHPRDDIPARGLDDVEYRWSYTVFLQVLGKYLNLKVDQGDLDYMYSYTRASLLHYAAWMLEHELPYKQVFHRVKLPTETWPAQDMRKSHVFYLAATYASDALLRDAFRQKAEFFYQACIQDLCSFPTCTLTRPLVLLLTNAYVHAYFQTHPEETGPTPAQRYDFGRPRQFTPQFYELYWVRAKLQQTIAALRGIG